MLSGNRLIISCEGSSSNSRWRYVNSFWMSGRFVGEKTKNYDKISQILPSDAKSTLLVRRIVYVWRYFSWAPWCPLHHKHPPSTAPLLSGSFCCLLSSCFRGRTEERRKDVSIATRTTEALARSTRAVPRPPAEAWLRYIHRTRCDRYNCWSTTWIKCNSIRLQSNCAFAPEYAV